MSSIVAGPPEVDIDYPEGPPSVPESDSHTTRRAELLFALRHWYASRGDTQDAWVSSDINVYYREGDPKVVVAPDLAVAFGVDVAAVKGKSVYKVWEAGAAPCFALEIASPRTLRTDLHVKPAKYASLGADEYWRLDPSGGELLNPPLQGERRQAGSWVPIEVVPEDDGLRGRSEALGLDLCWQPPKLRLWDIAAGVWLPDPDDLSEQAALAAEQAARADEQAALAAAQAARADEKAAALRAAEAELAELRARLDGNP
ncbi:MAG: Uma2 family endonuclease [Acidimicrobiaceae bacterium]|nr:Uma2 family endonuclease [Acidimicrobiaceae bacterium]